MVAAVVAGARDDDSLHLPNIAEVFTKAFFGVSDDLRRGRANARDRVHHTQISFALLWDRRAMKAPMVWAPMGLRKSATTTST